MEDINKIFSKMKFKKGRGFLTFGSSPEADWRIMLLSFMLLVIMVIGLCVYFFFQINLSDLESVDPEAPITSSTFNINKLRQTIDHYKNKGEAFEIIKVTPETVLDPSL